MSGPSEIESEIVTSTGLVDIASLSAVDRSAIDMQIATAKRYPRSVEKSLKEAQTLACLDEETAETMFYTLERKGRNNEKTFISGPSVRLAEVMLYAWGNMRVDGDISAEEKTYVEGQGTCFDLEKNIAVRVKVRRGITTSAGKRYGTDMINVTANASVSLAIRNAIVRVIPRTYIDRLYEGARKAALGEGTMVQKRQNSFGWFQQNGMKPAQVFQVLGVKGMDDVGEEHILILKGLRNAIKEGETTVEKLLRTTDGESGAASLNEALKADAPPAPPTP